VKRLNLTDPKLFQSAYFQLQPGDFIYVEPNKTKVNSTSLGFQIWPIVSSGISLIVVIFSVLR
jgi:polysaccharide export outer membrane protein